MPTDHTSMPGNGASQQLRARADDILALHDEGELEAAVDVARSLAADAEVAHRADPDDPVVRETLFTARYELALLQAELGDLPAAAAAYAEAAATPADPDEPDQRHEIAMAQLGGGICRDAIGDHQGALAVYDALIERFASADDPVTRDQVVRAKVNRAATLLAQDRAAEALEATSALLAELDPVEPLEAEQLAMAARVRATALRTLDRVADAVDALAEVERCADEDPAVRSQVAAAQQERAQALAELGRRDDALHVLDGALARFGDDPDPMVREVVDELGSTRASLAGASG